MKLCMFDDNRLGLIEADRVRDVTSALDVLAAFRYPLPAEDPLIAALPALTARIAGIKGGTVHRLSQVRLRSPVANPGKLVAAPVNYLAHIEEVIANEATFTKNHGLKIKETGLFLKATSSLVGAGDGIIIDHPDRRTDHEIELAVIIGRPCRHATVEDALSYVAGYSIGLDITIRGPEERSLRKSLDTYSVLGPWLVTADEFGDPAGRDLLLTVDGERRQVANTNNLIMDVPALIAFASSFYTLMPGDVLFTGTPEGVGPIRPDETIEASISGIGAMKVMVRSA